MFHRGAAKGPGTPVTLHPRAVMKV
jgi:hypothetical protein